MSKRYGRLVAAAGGLILALDCTYAHAQNSQAQQPTSPPAQPQAEAQKAAPAKAAPSVPAAQRPAAQPEEPAAQTAKPKSEHPAGAAVRWLFSASGTNFLIMLFTGGLLWIAWLQNRLEKRLAEDTADSINIARKSAEAAEASVALGREKAQRELRAYMLIDVVKMLNVAPAPVGYVETDASQTRPELPPRIAYSVKNSGKTPATDVCSYAWIFYSDYPLTHPLPERDPNIPLSKSATPAGGALFREIALAQALSEEEIEAMRQKTAAIYFVGEVTYRDVFDVEHRTRYLYFHNGHTGVVGVSPAMTHYMAGNEAD